METISTTEVTQTFPSIISKVQKEPVIIRENDCEVAVIMSIEDYKKLTEANIQKLQLFRKNVAKKAKNEGVKKEESNKKETTETNPIIDRKAFLELPIEERNRILKEQVEAMEEYYKTDSEWQDWVNIDLGDIDE
ncbi:type II toxin-antitoxin system Phd/YefM family antitoxin [Crocosphaera sp.]|uniref:type II toxin-antitoxin system Phd/YefM family antitoxin n=1 Tax=Crocosphaera sp. TaxID=2729996 RepID=UPI0026059041|nr:type II toxin-antitoxin system Phd/YefM family antitoxin [Crocosphaera sp.]MDJ0582787.1 type II toxin-antitoxin system Phd/YefM family antitoxin [Crocosphaera sp.]